MCQARSYLRAFVLAIPCLEHCSSRSLRSSLPSLCSNSTFSERTSLSTLSKLASPSHAMMPHHLVTYWVLLKQTQRWSTGRTEESRFGQSEEDKLWHRLHKTLSMPPREFCKPRPPSALGEAEVARPSYPSACRHWVQIALAKVWARAKWLSAAQAGPEEPTGGGHVLTTLFPGWGMGVVPLRVYKLLILLYIFLPSTDHHPTLYLLIYVFTCSLSFHITRPWDVQE